MLVFLIKYIDSRLPIIVKDMNLILNIIEVYEITILYNLNFAN